MSDAKRQGHEHLVLRCITKIYLNQTFSVDYDLHVLTPKAVPVPRYEMMCGAINEFIDLKYGESVLSKAEAVEAGKSAFLEAEGHAFTCWLTPDKVTFEFQYGANGPEKGGEVTLAQFKLAVQTYLQFLRDPDRKPIEVPFPS
jgi:hypothetical protein